MAAAMSGERHPMATVIADQAAALLSYLRASATNEDSESPRPGAPTNRRAHGSGDPGKYEPITVTVHDESPPRRD
jgi:hypothetical protein